MATLPDSDLQTIEHGTEGWNAIQSYNAELLDEKLRNVLKGMAKILGSATFSDNGDTSTSPETQSSSGLTDNSGGSVGNTIGQVSGSGADTQINNNFASATDQINKLITDMGEIYTALASVKALVESVQTSHNALLAELRKSTGNGVLGG